MLTRKQYFQSKVHCNKSSQLDQINLMDCEEAYLNFKLFWWSETRLQKNYCFEHLNIELEFWSFCLQNFNQFAIFTQKHKIGWDSLTFSNDQVDAVNGFSSIEITDSFIQLHELNVKDTIANNGSNELHQCSIINFKESFRMKNYGISDHMQFNRFNLRNE